MELFRFPGDMTYTFEGIYIAVDLHGWISLVGGPDVWRLENMVADGINEHLPSQWGSKEDEEDRAGFPARRGLYRCTIEYIYEQGYFEGYACDSESDVYVNCLNVEEIPLPDNTPPDIPQD